MGLLGGVGADGGAAEGGAAELMTPLVVRFKNPLTHPAPSGSVPQDTLRRPESHQRRPVVDAKTVPGEVELDGPQRRYADVPSMWNAINGRKRVSRS